MEFIEVLPFLMQGKKIKREQDDFALEYVDTDYEIWIVGGKDNNSPLFCSFSDFILSEDWEIVE